ncbi:hyoscyamine 6-dioxygenase-like [Tripterygium wilfordii]|uniref:Hyoscyamine 6-dioxygenase-like n=2 Tax=Tripterygium wilfordii TaxID=458696 RepID=A0A7J7C6Q3_TRIWF|nr:hyoscyamine 6-dioxygenase-like [Tripterygium wilfordii]
MARKVRGNITKMLVILNVEIDAYDLRRTELKTATTNKASTLVNYYKMAATKLLTDLTITAKDNIPPQYIRPLSDRPNLADQSHGSQASIPLIDLRGLEDPRRRSEIIKQITQACQDFGFFQLKNHGIPETEINNIVKVTREFFKLPESERLKYYSDDPSKTTRLSTSFNVKTEKVANWRDFLRLQAYPLQDFINEWPSSPPNFKKNVAEYCTSMRGLVLRLLELISESLGLERDYIDKALGKHGQHMAFNYYPPCPKPELTYGVPGHTDVGLITILLQDDVPGLQVLNNGNWVSVQPVPNTFIVNIGDQLQALSNDRYTSVLHRAVVNSGKDRVSIPTFYCPSFDAVIGPAKELIDDDHPAVYKDFTYAEYFKKFWNRDIATESCLDLFKATTNNNNN